MKTLRRWNPTPGADDGTADEAAARGGVLAPANLGHIERRDLVALHRAAKPNGWAERIFYPNPNLKHTPWYDEMEQIVDLEFEYVVDGNAVIASADPTNTRQTERKASPGTATPNGSPHE